ncbi:hypothetical protein P154DRAFT_595550 [Amniculicola lignicola CBS 123094]|uniref:Uncharacterized protein n=1 Tax=Amniculicola lignicola CBS 123094 TaxID=1392246 RepID=A0A6A5WKG0_9PLEO|nr:hypothetical protein P154DRAFT_595550 [Amniculicola lignicola CBS 123094]
MGPKNTHRWFKRVETYHRQREERYKRQYREVQHIHPISSNTSGILMTRSVSKREMEEEQERLAKRRKVIQERKGNKERENKEAVIVNNGDKDGKKSLHNLNDNDVQKFASSTVAALNPDVSILHKMASNAPPPTPKGRKMAITKPISLKRMCQIDYHFDKRKPLEESVAVPNSPTTAVLAVPSPKPTPFIELIDPSTPPGEEYLNRQRLRRQSKNIAFGSWQKPVTREELAAHGARRKREEKREQDAVAAENTAVAKKGKGGMTAEEKRVEEWKKVQLLWEQKTMREAEKHGRKKRFYGGRGK